MQFNQDAYLEDKREAVDAARAALEDARRKLDVAVAELRTAEDLLEQLAPKLARRGSQRKNSSGSSSRGRQRGSLSPRWKNTLLDLYDEYPEGFSVDEVKLVAEIHEIDIRRPSDVTRRLDSYLQSEYVIRDGERYKVTQHAVDHFDFAAMRLERSAGREENEASANDTSEAEADGGANTISAPEFQPNPSR